MISSKKNRFYLLVVSVITFIYAPLSIAQQLVPPPELSNKDAAGVDPISGVGTFSLTDLNIGSDFSALSHTIATYGNYYWNFIDNYSVDVGLGGSVTNNTTNTSVTNTGQIYIAAQVGHSTQGFRGEGDIMQNISTYKPKNGNGASLVEVEKYKFIYTMRDGTEVYANQNPQRIVYPNGYTIYIYKGIKGRKESVISNTGLQLKYFYNVNTLPASPSHQQIADATNPVRIVAFNNTIDQCEVAAASCNFSQPWPTVNYSWPTYEQMFNSFIGAVSTFTVTDALGRRSEFKNTLLNEDPTGLGIISPRTTSVKRFEYGATAKTQINYDSVIHCTSPREPVRRCSVIKPLVISNITINGKTWSYTYPTPDTPYVQVGESYGPHGNMTILMDTLGGWEHGGSHSPVISRITTPDGITANYHLDDRALVKDAIVKGKNFEYFYDKRTNLIKVTQLAALGSAEAGQTKISEAYYSNPDLTTCTNLKTCNQPTWVRDAKGNQTDYTYYEEHGGVKTVTHPAPSAGEARPTTWYKYEQKYAWYKKSNNSIERADTPVWLLTEERTCTQESANVDADTCVDPTKLLITRYNYGAEGVPNNLWKRGVEVISYNKTLRTCYQYDYYGNVIAETQPKAGLSSCQ